LTNGRNGPKWLSHVRRTSRTLANASSVDLQESIVNREHVAWKHDDDTAGTAVSGTTEPGGGLCTCGCGWAGDESLRRWRRELTSTAPAVVHAADDSSGTRRSGRSRLLPRLTLLR
jgi:hypothetical protein